MKKLPMDVQAKWVAALRSGKYEQAKGELRGLDKEGKPCMCCLGVLCDISGVNWEPREEEQETGYDDTEIVQVGYKTGKGSSEMPNEADEPDLPEDIGEILQQTVDARTVGVFLAYHNDGAESDGIRYDKWDFSKIADWIEENL